MSRVMFVQPWNYHDEGIKVHDLAGQWRNGPYAILLLATQLRKHHHQVAVVDMSRDLVVLQGSVDACLNKLSQEIEQFNPDIIAFSFFSIHYFEVKRAVEAARQTCEKLHIQPIFLAGGIHASTDPHGTIQDLGFDLAFVGEGDVGLVKLADGQKPDSILGIISSSTVTTTMGEQIEALDSLPFPDWSLCDYQFYAYPSYGRIKHKKSSSLDLIMGRGCFFKCAFCAYNAISAVRGYSAEYLVEQVEYMEREFGIDGLFFTDSTIGNYRRTLIEFCELMIKRGTAKRVEWYVNIRANQVTEDLLKLMSRAGCKFWFYGFESGSQRVLDLMVKGIKVESNYRIAELHNKLRLPYHASMMLGYPGEQEEDIFETFKFLRTVKPPIVGINWYVPLPGSPDYDKLKAEKVIQTEDPWEWRRIGEVNSAKVYADVPEPRFRELYDEATRIAYSELPAITNTNWNFLTPNPAQEKAIQESKLIFMEMESVSGSKFDFYVEKLRQKWKEIPTSAIYRGETTQLLDLPDDELLSFWLDAQKEDSIGDGFRSRGWYRAFYQGMMRGKKVMDVGSGLGVDGVTFAQQGAHITFVDIVESNLQVIQRICHLLNVENVQFHYLEPLASLERLDKDYDVIWCLGSLINSPFEVTREEVQAIVQHLKTGGHWIELGYPEVRWEREGRMPFEEWGAKTDGGAPWIEWKDLAKMNALLNPVEFDTALYFDFHDSDFNWFDLVRKSSSTTAIDVAISSTQVNDLMVAIDKGFNQLASCLQASQQEVVQLQSQLSQLQNELQFTKDRFEETKVELQQNKEAKEQIQAALESQRNQVAAMESSKFWQLRTQWIEFRKRLRLPG